MNIEELKELKDKADAELETCKKIGKAFTEGALIAISNAVIVVGCLLITGTLLRNGCAWDTDDSDQSGWHRSGLTIHTDARTGVQYFSDGHGGLCVRMSTTNGMPMIKTKHSRYYYE